MKKRTEKSLWRKIRSLVLTLGLVLLVFGSGSAFAATVYVDDNAADGGGGTSWADARNSLADALSAAIPAEGETIEIWVASGTYRPTENSSDRDASFVLKNGVALYGGFAGNETISSDRDPAANVTVLTGDIDSNDAVDGLGVTASADQIEGNNSYHVVTAEDGTAVLDGFTITGGEANSGSVAGNSGGGMYVKTSSSLAVRNCVFCGSAARWDGAGMYCDGGSLPTVDHCTFRDNRSGSSGGGIYNHKSPVVVRNCVFSGNAAYYGGGMANNIYDPDIIKPEVRNCIFIGNCATGFVGGGMYNSYSRTAVTNCTFAGNRAPKGAGMANQQDSDPTVVNCTFYENVADDLGGGMYNFEGSSPVLVNCTFGGNRAVTGAGMCSQSDNSSCSSKPHLSNCLLWDGEGGEIFNEDEFSKPTLEYCLVRGGDAGTGSILSGDIIFGDPLLGPLEDNGSDIRCGAPGEERTIQTLSLGLGSPAIDAGLAAKAPSVDQRGESRPQGHGDDIGAFEFDEWYVLTVPGDVGGAVSVSRYGEVSGNCPVMSGDVLSVEAIPADGWVFERWSDDLDGTSNPVEVMMDGNKTVTASFVPKTFTVTFAAGEHGSVNGELSQTVCYGSDCSPVTAVPHAGYRFVGWMGDVEGLSDEERQFRVLTVSDVTSPLSLTATFAMDCHIESDAFDVTSPTGEMHGRIGAKDGGTPLDFRLSVENFLAEIESGAEGQILEVIDSEGRVKEESDRIRPGDLLRVTASDGSTSIYVIDAKYLIYFEVGEGGGVSVACEYGGDLNPDGEGYLAVEPDCVITFTVRPDEKWRIDELLYNANSVSEDVLTEISGGYEFDTEPVDRNGAFSAEFARQGSCPAVPVLVSPDASASSCDLIPLLRTEAYEPSGAGEHGETRWEIAFDDAFTQVVFDVRTHRYLTEIRTGRDVLSPGRTYHWRVRFFDDAGTPSAWSASRSFTTVEAKKAGLDNGVPSTQALSADEEIELPGEWDASNASADCKIFRGATEGEQIGIRAHAGSRVIEQAESLPKEVLSDDMGTGDLLKLPRGLVSFRIKLDESDIAGSASVRVHFSSPLPPELRYWYKYSEAEGWTDYSDRATFAPDGSWVDLELRDGGEGDADGLANAVIVDPGGPGRLAIGGDDSLDSGCGHGCDVFGSMPDAVLLLVPFAFLLGRRR